MRRPLAVLGAMTGLLLLSAGIAAAESQTVAGTGDIQQMVASNGQTAVNVKVHGMAPPCETHWLNVDVDWRGPDYYRATVGCYPGATWAKSLYYHDSADDQNPQRVRCAGFVFRWDGDRELFKVVIPRSCLSNAPNRIRVAADGHVYTSPGGSEAGPTRLLARG